MGKIGGEVTRPEAFDAMEELNERKSRKALPRKERWSRTTTRNTTSTIIKQRLERHDDKSETNGTDES